MWFQDVSGGFRGFEGRGGREGFRGVVGRGGLGVEAVEGVEGFRVQGTPKKIFDIFRERRAGHQNERGGVQTKMRNIPDVSRSVHQIHPGEGWTGNLIFVDWRDIVAEQQQI